MPELDISLVDGGELKFNQYFLQFNVKKIQMKSSCQYDFRCWILETATLNSLSIAIITSTSL